MKTLFRPYLAFLFLGSLLTITACKDDEVPEPDEEQELITTVTLRLDPEDTDKGQSVSATWRDLDGPGGQPETKETLTLQPNMVYNGTLTILDESQTGKTVDITAEVREEGEEHQVFYVVDPQSLLTIQTTDTDNKSRPLGLQTTVTTDEVTGTGTIRIVLKHQPKLKSASSNINTGETDVDIKFDTIVQD
ncbi:hypothetical protein [Botryobacter ruber]|uniref:hypothetical protein n=1 Tax=Botryobacter ruber TaxID=2171629 RepID=UPI000F646251|nr:hypothetical protein [Botryobacter ruber]